MFLVIFWTIIFYIFYSLGRTLILKQRSCVAPPIFILAPPYLIKPLSSKIIYLEMTGSGGPNRIMIILILVDPPHEILLVKMVSIVAMVIIIRIMLMSKIMIILMILMIIVMILLLMILVVISLVIRVVTSLVEIGEEFK